MPGKIPAKYGQFRAALQERFRHADFEIIWGFEAEYGRSEKVALLAENIFLERLDECVIRLCIEAVATAASYFALEQTDSPLGHGQETESSRSARCGRRRFRGAEEKLGIHQ